MVSTGDVWVIVALRGGMDGLGTVIPHGDSDYPGWRRALRILAPGKGPGCCLDLDGFFGLHPAMAPLMRLWEEGDLEIIHAAGWPGARHSHFEAWEEIESGVEGAARPSSGWLGRALTEANVSGPLAAVALSETLPFLLKGFPGAVLMPSADAFRLEVPAGARARVGQALDRLHAGCRGPLEEASRSTLAALGRVDEIRGRIAAGTGGYPATRFGQRLRLLGELIRSGLGVRAAVIDLPGWDTHFGQGAARGPMAEKLRELAEGFAAFWTHVRTASSRVGVLAFSEFGRRVEENGSAGTDHGQGGVVLRLGRSIGNGRVKGSWPGLARHQLSGPGDVAVTTDLRRVFEEVSPVRWAKPVREPAAPAPSVSGRPGDSYLTK